MSLALSKPSILASRRLAILVAYMDDSRRLDSIA